MIWIGVDAHKQVHQAVAPEGDGGLSERTIGNTPEGWASLLAWGQQWPEQLWAVEGSGSLGGGVAQFLAEHGERVHEVCPKWTAQRRRTLRKPGKSDRLDALAVAHLLREEPTTLPLVLPDEEAVATVQLWSRLRKDVVADMTRVRNRLHALLLLCDPEYKARIPDLTTRTGIRACQVYTAPGQGALAREREQAVRQVAAQLALLADQERQLEDAVAGRSAPLQAILGLGPLTAAALVAELGAPRPGLGESQLAALAGVAPLEASSAGGVRHRLNRQGNRRLNRLFRQITLTQQRVYAPAQRYLARRKQEGRTPREARRALKRLLVRSIWRQWQACWTPAPAFASSTT